MKTAVVGWNSFREYVKTEGRGWLEGVWFEQIGKSVKICENRRGWLEQFSRICEIQIIGHVKLQEQTLSLGRVMVATGNHGKIHRQ